MKKVVLLGDSIRLIGYGNPVADMLKDEFDVWQPEENCRDAHYTLRRMFDWKDNIKGADVVHWNNGLWDVCQLFGDGYFTEPEIYVKDMLRIAWILKTYARKVIFATTTPVRDKYPWQDNSTIDMYNAMLVPELEKAGIIISDLGGAIKQDIEAYIREDDMIHLSEAGIKAAAELTAEAIRRAAE